MPDIEELQARIAKLSTDIDLQNEVLRELVQSKSAAQRLLNAIRDPVARLPFELSSEIFLHCLPQQRKPDACTAPMLLLGVCNAWTGIALSTPALWSAIYLDFPGTEILRLWLQRSHSFSLHIHRALNNDVATTLSQHAARLQHLRIDEEMIHPSVVTQLGSFPCLRTLTVEGLPDNFNGLHCFPRGLLRMAPNLVECTFHMSYCDPHYNGEIIILRDLRCLKFGANINLLRSDAGILRYLDLPRLETLFVPLARIHYTVFSAFLERSSPPLQTLVLGDACSLSFTELNECLRLVPSLINLELSGSCTDDILSELADSPSHFLPNLRRLRIQIRHDLSEESYLRLLRALSVRRARLACFTLTRFNGVLPEPCLDIRAGLRQLIADGMEISIGTIL
ncbi:hypothetical protein DFH06DRAFT_1184552 [Mycena polygramma]|nr:hypothetical protein DFH06DRAFT_1184552 [Mycena polygramma]